MRYLFAFLVFTVLAACAGPQTTANQPPATVDNIVTQNVTTDETVEELAQAAVAQPFSGLPQLQWNNNANRRELLVVGEEGTLLTGYEPVVLGTDADFASLSTFSPDGRLLAAFESRGQSCHSYAGGTSCRPSADVLHLIDVASWQETVAALPGSGYVWPVVFNEGSSQIAFAYNTDRGSELMLVDTAAGSLINQAPLDFPLSTLAFAGDGRSLVAVGAEPGERPGISRPGITQVQLLDLATLETTWDQPLPDLLDGFWCMENCDGDYHELMNAMWTPAIVLSRDRSALYIVHADSDQLTTVDLQARTVKRVAIEVAQSWFDRLLTWTAGVAEAKGAVSGATRQAVVSADGSKLYLIGENYHASWNEEADYWDAGSSSLGFKVVDIASGRVLDKLEYQAAQITLTPDGAYLLLHEYQQGGPVTTILDAGTLEELGTLDAYEVASTYQLNGQSTLVGMQYTTQGVEMAVMDNQTLEIIHFWSAADQTSWVPVATP
jgi:hypothetical protein